MPEAAGRHSSGCRKVKREYADSPADPLPASLRTPPPREQKPPRLALLDKVAQTQAKIEADDAAEAAAEAENASGGQGKSANQQSSCLIEHADVTQDVSNCDEEAVA